MSPDLDHALTTTGIHIISLSESKRKLIDFLDKRGFFIPNNEDTFFAHQVLRDIHTASDSHIKACQRVITSSPEYLFQDIDKAMRLESLLGYIQRHSPAHEVLSPAVTMLINNTTIAGKQGIITPNHNLYFDVLLSSTDIPSLLRETNGSALHTLKQIYQSPNATSWRQEIREGRALTTDKINALNQLTPDPSVIHHQTENSLYSQSSGSLYDYNQYRSAIKTLRDEDGLSEGLTDSSRPKSGTP